jgi:DnaJ-domain-containing protein 1
VYTDIFKADAKMRTHPVKEKTEADERFIAVKDRLEQWLSALDDQDPYRVLGVSPSDSPDVVRARFKELALERHPDRGGSEAKMRELNLAYEKILRHRQRKRIEALEAGTVSSMRPATALPTSGR